MRLLIFGRTGQIATELSRAAKADPDLSATALGRRSADLTDPATLTARVAATDADVIINAAAYTAVDRAEDEPALAAKVNAEAPGVIARAAAARGIPMIHISTDYVFDGSGTAPWRESDPTGPLGVYGRTKLAGEEAVRAAGGPHAVLRVAWVFSAQGSNFVRTVLRLSETLDRLRIVHDQIGGPTAAADVAATCLTLARAFADGRAPSGTYHYAGSPDVSWADFAREIVAGAGLAVPVDTIPTAAYPTKAQRPANSRLDCSLIRTTFGIDRPDWRVSLRTVLADLRSREGAPL